MYKKMKKRLLSLLLAAGLIAGTAPLTPPVHAAAMGTTPISISDIATDAFGTGWSWVASTRTLTLNGFTYEGNEKCIFIVDYVGTAPVNFVINGENIINSTQAYNNPVSFFTNSASNFTISGNGTLTCKGKGGADGITIGGQKITMTGGTLICDSGGSSDGIVFDGSTVMEGGTITGIGSNSAVNFKKSLTMTGGTITGYNNPTIYGTNGVYIGGAGSSITGGTINGRAWTTTPSGNAISIVGLDNKTLGNSMKVINGIKDVGFFGMVDPTANGGFVTITNAFAITYNTNGGSEVANKMCAGTLTGEMLPTPVKTGHTFDGWYYDNTTFANKAKVNDTLSAPTTLYAKWTAAKYDLTVNAGGNIKSVTAVSTLDGALSLDIYSGTQVTYGASVTLTAVPNDGAEFFLWDNSGFTLGSGNNQSTVNPYTFTMPAADSAVEFTATGLGGVEAKGTMEVNSINLLEDCAVTVSVTKDSAAYTGFAGAVTLRSGAESFALIGTGGSRTGSFPQNGKEYAVWVDAADSGKTVTLNGTTATATVPYTTYTVPVTKDGMPGYNPGVIVIEYPKDSGNFVTDGAVLPTGTYDVYVDGNKAGTTAGLAYFTATFSDGTADYAAGTPWAPQAVIKDGFATLPTAMPTAEGKSFTGWDKPVETTKITAATTFTAGWTVNAECDVRWVIDGYTTYGTLKQGLDATSTAGGGYIEVQKSSISLSDTGELHPNAILNIPTGKTVNTDGKLTTRGSVENVGTISGGLTNSGSITGGGTVTSLTNSGTVTGGTVTTLISNTGTVKGATMGTVTANTGGTLDGCTINGGTGIGGTLKGYTYAGHSVTFSGADASAAMVNIQGGNGGFAGLKGANDKLGANLMVREGIITSGTLDMNGHSIRGADGAVGAGGITPIITGGNLTIIGQGSIRGGAGGSSSAGAAGAGGHGINATGNFDLTLGKDVSAAGGQGGAGAGSFNGGAGGCGIHGSNHSGSANSGSANTGSANTGSANTGSANTGSITVSGSTQGGAGGPGVGTSSTGGTGGYAVCGGLILDDGGSMNSGSGGEGRADDPTNEESMGIENTDDVPDISGTLKYGVVTDLTHLDATGDTSADEGADFTLTLSAKNSNRYITLPDSIAVTMSGKALTAGTGYTYDKATGMVVVKKPITSALTITAIGVVAESATVTAADQLEDALEVPVKRITVDGDITMGANGELFVGGVLTVSEGHALTLNGKTLTNKGVIIVNGSLVGTVTDVENGLVLALPTAVANAPYNALTGLRAGMSYINEGKTYTAGVGGSIPIPDAWCGKSISIAQTGRDYTGPAQSIDLTAIARAKAPAAADFEVKQPMAATGASSTGSVAFAPDKSGTYEYSTDGGYTWTPFPALPSIVDGLPQGTEVLIRVPANGTTPASEALIIKIKIYRSGGGNNPAKPEDKPSGTLPESGMSIETITRPDGSKENQVTVDSGKLDQIVKDLENGGTVLIPVKKPDGGSVSVTIPGNSMNDMADKDMSVTVDTGNTKVELPGGSIPGKSDVTVTVTPPIREQSDSIKEKVEAGGAQVITIPDQVTVTVGGEIVDSFDGYVSRTFEITAEQAAKITTAVVPRQDGTLRHLPTYVFEEGGKYYAKVNALVNEPVSALIFNEQSFQDAKGTWYEATASEMAARKIVSGTAADTFSGERGITRAEFAVIVVRALGLPDSGTGEQFGDVNANDWYAGAIDAATRYGIVRGKTDVLFDPKANITRQEAMVMLARAATLARFTAEGGDLSQFSDADTVGGWAADGVAFSVGAGLIMGSNGELRLGDDISRAESATVILRLLQKTGLVDVRSGR